MLAGAGVVAAAASTPTTPHLSRETDMKTRSRARHCCIPPCWRSHPDLCPDPVHDARRRRRKNLRIARGCRQGPADAVRAADVNMLLAVAGPDSRSWLLSGDDIADRELEEISRRLRPEERLTRKAT